MSLEVEIFIFARRITGGEVNLHSSARVSCEITYENLTATH